MRTTIRKPKQVATAEKAPQVVIDVQIADLQPHPLQAVIFPEPTEAEIDRLAADILDRGLQQPIDITPDMLTISGHRRISAMLKNGATTIKAVVRYDLAEQGTAAIDRHFVAENFFRQQLGRLAKARCARHLVELAQGGKGEAGDVIGRVDARKAVAALLDISDREVSRLLAVLKTPLEIQAAYEAEQLTLVEAGKVASLSPKQQGKIAAAIRKGESPRAAMAELTFKTRVARTPAATDYVVLLDQLDRVVRSLDAVAHPLSEAPNLVAGSPG